MFRIPRYLDSRLIDGGKAVCLTRRTRYTPQKHFCWKLSKPLSLVRTGRLDKLVKIIYLHGSGTRDRLACSAVSSPLHHRVPPICVAWLGNSRLWSDYVANEDCKIDIVRNRSVSEFAKQHRLNGIFTNPLRQWTGREMRRK
jgi:hypothetical protein